tara:strand:+ start:188 stop:460 length:273 start_codon:yes stop_codon:yes gene_type:complete
MPGHSKENPQSLTPTQIAIIASGAFLVVGVVVILIVYLMGRNKTPMSNPASSDYAKLVPSNIRNAAPVQVRQPRNFTDAMEAARRMGFAE